MLNSFSSLVSESGIATLGTSKLLFLGVALAVTLMFEFVNGFHDTANAVATVIYTKAHSPVPRRALQTRPRRRSPEIPGGPR